MVAAIWIVRKLTTDKKDVFNGIETVVFNNDSVDTEAVTLAAAATLLSLPTGYFDTAVLALTDMSTDQDLVACGERLEIIA